MADQNPQAPQSPQDIAAQIVDAWYSAMEIVCVATQERAILEPIIAAAIQAERDRHAAEVAQAEARHAAELTAVRNAHAATIQRVQDIATKFGPQRSTKLGMIIDFLAEQTRRLNKTAKEAANA